MPAGFAGRDRRRERDAAPGFPGALCAQSCLTLHNRMDCGLPGSCVHGVSGAKEKPEGPFSEVGGQ